MRRRVAYPFLTLSETAIEAPPWRISLNGGDFAVIGDYLPDWDMASTIRIQREMRIEERVAADDLRLDPEEICFAVGVRLGTGSGRLPRYIVQAEQQKLDSGRSSAVFDIELEGNQLSSVLDIFTEVTLASVPRERSPLSPSRVGDRLWDDRCRVRLEGEEARFPIEVADFSSPVLLGGSLASTAPWYLYWSPLDWSRDFYGAIRLYLNSNHGDFVKNVEDEDNITLQAIMADVMGQVCERLLLDENAEEIISDAEPGSLGAQASTWLQHAWPGSDYKIIRTILENRPGKFRAAFLALAELAE